jgi:hypothetical protein
LVAGITFELGQTLGEKLVLVTYPSSVDGSYESVVTLDNCSLMPVSTNEGHVVITVSPSIDVAAFDSE